MFEEKKSFLGFILWFIQRRSFQVGENAFSFQSMCVLIRGVLVHWPGLTLHPRGTEALASEEDCVVVVLGVLRVAFLLHEGPAAHVLQAARRVASLDEADGLTEIEKMFTTQP